jgi:glycosyltransferase involved in cell wall biosynthesis
MEPVLRPTRLLFDDHNCEYVLQKRAAETDWRHPSRWLGAAYSSVQWRRLRSYEREVCRRSDLVIAVSADDARALRRLVPDLETLVIPNGIAVSEYAAFSDSAELRQPAFIFTGTMDFRPNVDGVLWFADHVWPQVRAALPHAHFYIVGRRPHKRLERLSAVPGIVVTGPVPDTRPYIRAATVYVVPLLVGGGTRLKLLESTAMGKPVVSTTLGAEGFILPGQAMLLADSPADFAQACINLASDAAAQRQWAERASQFAQAYAWERLIPPLLERLAQ